MSENWWRAYNNSIHHRKLLKLSDAMHRAWYTLQCIASENGGDLPPADDIAVTLRIKAAKVAEWITCLVRADLYENVGGTFRPKNWDRRQYKTDATDPTGAKRAKEYRDRKRDERDASRGVTRDATVRRERPEAEAYSEADSEQSRADAPALVDEDLKRKTAALQAGVRGQFAGRGFPVPSLDRCSLWLSQGFGPGTVLWAIETVLKRGKPISTLEYFDGAIRDRHANDVPVAALVDTMAGWHIIIEGTPEEICWQQWTREKTGKPMFICKQLHEGREVRGAKKPTLYPPGFNDFGERIAPSDQEENAA